MTLPEVHINLLIYLQAVLLLRRPLNFIGNLLYSKPNQNVKSPQVFEDMGMNNVLHICKTGFL